MLTEPLEQLNPLPHPWEPLILKDGQSITFRVNSFREGSMVIHPKDQPEGKLIRAIRLYGTRVDRHSNAPWFDVTTTQLQHLIAPYLESVGFGFGTFKLMAQGAGIRKTFQVVATPPGPQPAAERFA